MYQDILGNSQDMVDPPFMPARGISEWRHLPFPPRPAGWGQGFRSTRPGTPPRDTAASRPHGIDPWRLAGLAGPGAPALKPPVQVDLDTPFVATRDGFVLARGECEDDAAGWLEGLQTLGGIATVVALASYQCSPLENVRVRSNSFCMPVRKGTPFKVRSTTVFGNPRVWAYFCELSRPMGFPGAMEALSPGLLYRARKNGILLAHICACENGAGHGDEGSFGRIEAQSWPDADGSSADGLLETASARFHRSGRWIKGNSVMLPVPAGNSFRVDLRDSTGPHRVQVWWMAVSARA